MRIVGGEFRSRSLETPKGDRTRPTADRVREALFSVLESKLSIQDVQVLDLYAGTGALGLEALSRGAAHCVFVEQHRSALEVLDRNIQALGVKDRARVVRGNVQSVNLTEIPKLIFADPPYADVHPSATLALTRLRARFQADPERIWVLEHAARTQLPPLDGLESIETRRYGDTALSLFIDA